MSAERNHFAWNGEENLSPWFKRLVRAALGDPADPDALKELAVWVFQKVYAIAREKTGLDLDSIAQDCLIKIWKHRQAIVARDNPIACCLVLIKNIIRDHLRRQARRPAIPTIAAHGDEETDLLDATPDPGANPVETAMLRESLASLRNAIEKALQAYPNQQDSDYCRLHYFEGMEIREIARKYGVDRNRVDVGLSRVRAWLREQLPDQLG